MFLFFSRVYATNFVSILAICVVEQRPENVCVQDKRDAVFHTPSNPSTFSMFSTVIRKKCPNMTADWKILWSHSLVISAYDRSSEIENSFCKEGKLFDYWSLSLAFFFSPMLALAELNSFRMGSIRWRLRSGFFALSQLCCTKNTFYATFCPCQERHMALYGVLYKNQASVANFVWFLYRISHYAICCSWKEQKKEPTLFSVCVFLALAAVDLRFVLIWQNTLAGGIKPGDVFTFLPIFLSRLSLRISRHGFSSYEHFLRSYLYDVDGCKSMLTEWVGVFGPKMNWRQLYLHMQWHRNARWVEVTKCFGNYFNALRTICVNISIGSEQVLVLATVGWLGLGDRPNPLSLVFCVFGVE